MLYITADHAGFELKDKLKTWFVSNSIEFIDIAPDFEINDDYPVRSDELAQYLHDPDNRGMAICGTGQGICIGLNRYSHIRAVSPSTAEITALTRLHNDANVLCLDGRFMDFETVIEIVIVFLETKFSDEPRHIRRIEMLSRTDLNLK